MEEATIDQIHKAMADGALSSVELTSMYLNRIAVYDQGGIKLNSVPAINPGVFAEAAAADARLSEGLTKYPLNGVPVVLKDVIDVVGLPTTAGAKVLSDFKPIVDAPMVSGLKGRGAIMLGKANLDTFQNGSSGYSEKFGLTLNPYDLTKTTGGSSSGSAAAVAANLAVVGVGEQTTCSIILPASFMGVSAVKSSRGLVSSRGTTGAGNDGCWGVMSRTIKDSGLAMAGVGQFDAEDKLGALARFPGDNPTSYVDQIRPGLLAGKRFAIPKEIVYGLTPADPYYEELGFYRGISAPTLTAFQQAVQKLRQLGATVEEVSVSAFIGSYVNGIGGGSLDSYLRDEFLNRLFNPSGMSFLQALPGLDIGTDGAVVGNLESIKNNEVLAPWDGPANKAFWASLITAYNETLAPTLAQYDAFVMPGTQSPSQTVPFDGYGTDDLEELVPNDVFNFNFDYMFHYVGMPTITTPMGFTTAGLPMTLSFVGKPYSEPSLVAFANSYATATNLRRAPALTPALPGETIEYSTALPPPSRPELNAPALRVAAGAKVAGKGKKATLVLTGGAVDASGLGSLTVYVNGKKIAAKKAKNWKASVKLAALRSFVKGSVKTVQVTVVAKDVYGNTSVTTKNVKLPKEA